MGKRNVQNTILTVIMSLIGLTSLAFVGFNGVIQGNSIFLPIILKPLPPTSTPTFTSTPTYTPTPTFTPTVPVPPTLTFTPTNTPTPTPNPSIGSVDITSIYYNGSGSSEPDEYVVIKNIDTHNIQLQGWTLRDNANHIYTFPSFSMVPQQICRIYTNQSHPEYCGFNYGSSSAIWNNTGDCAFLRNAQGTQVDQYCY